MSVIQIARHAAERVGFVRYVIVDRVHVLIRGCRLATGAIHVGQCQRRYAVEIVICVERLAPQFIRVCANPVERVVFKGGCVCMGAADRMIHRGQRHRRQFALIVVGQGCYRRHGRIHRGS